MEMFPILLAINAVFPLTVLLWSLEIFQEGTADNCILIPPFSNLVANQSSLFLPRFSLDKWGMNHRIILYSLGFFLLYFFEGGTLPCHLLITETKLTVWQSVSCLKAKGQLGFWKEKCGQSALWVFHKELFLHNTPFFLFPSIQSYALWNVCAVWDQIYAPSYAHFHQGWWWTYWLWLIDRDDLL